MPTTTIPIADDHTLVRQLCEGLGGFTVVAEAEDGVRKAGGSGNFDADLRPGAERSGKRLGG
jgi:hypothetical protein